MPLRVKFFLEPFKIHQRGVQWKQGVVIHMMLYTSLLYNTTPIQGTPLPLHPPVMNTQPCEVTYATIYMDAQTQATSSAPWQEISFLICSFSSS